VKHMAPAAKKKAHEGKKSESSMVRLSEQTNYD
jgi:hypothetical protein